MEVRQLIRMLSAVPPNENLMLALFKIEKVIYQRELDEDAAKDMLDCIENIADLTDQSGLHEYVPDYDFDHIDPHEYSLGHCSHCIIPN
jgi:hypothetical protein